MKSLCDTPLFRIIQIVMLMIMLTFGTVTCAQEQSKTPTSARPQTSDGRAFEGLSKINVDALSRVEKEAYYAWKNALLDAEIVRINENNARLDLEIVAEYEKMIGNFRALHAGGSHSLIYYDIKKILGEVIQSGKPETIKSLIDADLELKRNILR